jgi:hypothetical protein
MPPDVSHADSLSKYCEVLFALRDLPGSVADPMVAASRQSLGITHAQHCEASARVFGGGAHAKGPSPTRAPAPKKPIAKKPSGRMSVAKRPAAAAAGTADPLLWQRVKVFWSDYGQWYEGVVSAVNETTGEHCTLYGFGTDAEEVCWHNLREWPVGCMSILGKASPALIAKIDAWQRGEDDAVAPPPPPPPPQAASNALGEMSWEQLEAKLDKTNSEAMVDNIGREVAARKADLLARLAALGDSDDESDME